MQDKQNIRTKPHLYCSDRCCNKWSQQANDQLNCVFVSNSVKYENRDIKENLFPQLACQSLLQASSIADLAARCISPKRMNTVLTLTIACSLHQLCFENKGLPRKHCYLLSNDKSENRQRGVRKLLTSNPPHCTGRYRSNQTSLISFAARIHAFSSELKNLTKCQFPTCLISSQLKWLEWQPRISKFRFSLCAVIHPAPIQFVSLFSSEHSV